MLKQILESLNESKDFDVEFENLKDALQGGDYGKDGEDVYQKWYEDVIFPEVSTDDPDEEMEFISNQDDKWFEDQYKFLAKEVKKNKLKKK